MEQLGRDDEALSLLERALAIQQLLHDADHPQVEEARLELASLHARLGSQTGSTR